MSKFTNSDTIFTLKNRKIVVYSTPTCHYCTMAKNYFTKMGVVYEDKNVGVDRIAAQEMIDKSMSKFVNFDTIFTCKNRIGVPVYWRQDYSRVPARNF